MIPFPIPWRLIGIAVGVLALVGGLWWVQHRISISYSAERERDAAVANLTNYQAAVEAAARVAAAQLVADQKADAALTSRMTALQADNEALRRAVSRLASTVERPDANGVPRLAINGDWWLCHSALLTRDPADSAACEARAGAPSVPDSVGH